MINTRLRAIAPKVLALALLLAGASAPLASGEKSWKEKALDNCNAGYEVSCSAYREFDARDKKLASTLAECNAGSAQACNDHGETVEYWQEGPEDFAKAMTFYNKACELGLAVACSNASQQRIDGTAVAAADPKQELEQLKDACAKDIPVACANYAYHLSGSSKMKGVKKDKKLATDLSQKACGRGIGFACRNLATWTLDKKPKGAERLKGLNYHRDACLAKEPDPKSCSDIGQAYLSGKGVTADWVEATTYFTRGCDKGMAASCFGLGQIREAGGSGIRVDIAAANEFYRRACNNSLEDACPGYWRTQDILDSRSQRAALTRTEAGPWCAGVVKKFDAYKADADSGAEYRNRAMQEKCGVNNDQCSDFTVNSERVVNRDLNEKWCSDAMDLADAAVEAACPGMVIQLMVDTARAYTPTQGCEYRAANFGQ